MSAGFGWSVGDVVLLAKTIRIVIHALDNDHGAVSEYQRAIKSLHILQTTLEEIYAIVSNAQPVFRNAVRGQLDQSTSSIAEFNTKLKKKYGHALGSNNPKSKFRWTRKKLGWAFVAAKELEEFRLQLIDQLNTVKLLMIADTW